MVFAVLSITAREFFDNFVGAEIYSMSWTCLDVSFSYSDFHPERTGSHYHTGHASP